MRANKMLLLPVNAKYRHLQIFSAIKLPEHVKSKDKC